MGVRLTMRGRSQARQAARTVADLVPHGTPTIASDQKRAVQTARPIARVLGVQVMTDPRLREQESLADVAERCHSLLDDLAARHLSAIVLVTHGDTMRILLGILDGRSHRDLDWDLSLTNGSVMVRNVDLGELH